MKKIKQSFSVSFDYDICFTKHLFDPSNSLFADTLCSVESDTTKKVLFILDEGMYAHHPELFTQIQQYAARHSEQFELVEPPIVIPGGEAAKNHPELIRKIHKAVDEQQLDRHCFVTVVGGGAVIDAAGYAAATAHRGIRLIRVPTTVLAQNDASVGVKNGINAFGKKNFLGTFVPPFAVLNDHIFLKTLRDRDWRAGISEAVKVALIKDAGFFDSIETQAGALAKREDQPMKELIARCAELHLEHIATSGDPFEMGSSRPLDFGHWAAHKLEQLTNFELRHGEAVAIGIALDVTYSYLSQYITRQEWERVLSLFKTIGFELYVPELSHKLDRPDQSSSLFHGLDEFREHLGGELTIMLLDRIGKGFEVHEVDLALFKKAVHMLQSYEQEWPELAGVEA